MIKVHGRISIKIDFIKHFSAVEISKSYFWYDKRKIYGLRVLTAEGGEPVTRYKIECLETKEIDKYEIVSGLTFSLL